MYSEGTVLGVELLCTLRHSTGCIVTVYSEDRIQAVQILCTVRVQYWV